ncbi:MAG TPA: hemolysin family protein [Bacteroidota bacterium]|nr:hemolysin family protein [Bacteroidota bacterium]
MDFWSAFFNIALVIFFVLLNGFFVAAEFAIVKVRATQIEPLAAKGNLRARIAKELITHLDAYLSATQLGITMASLALGWIGEPFVASMIRPSLERWGVQNPKIIQGVSFGLAFGLITLLHIVLGELAPKSLAIQKPRQTTLWIAYPLKLFYVVFRPIINFFNGIANAILRLVGLHTVTESELMHSEEELRMLLAQTKHGSRISKNILLRAMDFRKKQARHIMVPRNEIVALSISAPVQENIGIMRANKYSRYPVYKESLDNVLGVVHTKDIFKHDRHLKPDFTLESVLRDATFVPETVLLEQVLETMLQKKTHMLLLADEYGGTAGLITLEDVLEELVGTIQDEFDRETPDVTKVSDDEYVVDATLTTNDVERLINQELSSKDILSIGAFVIEQLGHIPKKGESVRVNGVQFIIEQVSDKAIETIRVKRLPAIPQLEENQ